jgi:hypothetical protein
MVETASWNYARHATILPSKKMANLKINVPYDIVCLR